MLATATADVWAEGEYEWDWLRQRIELPEPLPFPLPDGKVIGRVIATASTAGQVSVAVELEYLLPAAINLWGVEVAPRITLGVQAEYDQSELAGVTAAWDNPASGPRIAGRAYGTARVRLPVVNTGPLIHFHTGDADGWIDVAFDLEIGSEGVEVHAHVKNVGRVDVWMPGLPTADAPIRLALETFDGRVKHKDDKWSGTIEASGTFGFHPQLVSDEPAIREYVAPLIDMVDLDGEVACTITVAEEPSLVMRGRVTGGDASVDILGLMRDMSRGMSSTNQMPGLNADNAAMPQLGFEFSGVSVEISQTPRIAIDVAAKFGGAHFPAYFEISTEDLRVGLGTSSLALHQYPLELPLRVPYITAEHLGFPDGVAASRQSARRPPDQWIYDRIPDDDGRKSYDDAVQAMVDGVEILTGVASGASGIMIARQFEEPSDRRWELREREPGLEAEIGDSPFHVGTASVEHLRGGEWRLSGDLAVVARIDGTWHVLMAAPRVRFNGVYAVLNWARPREIRAGGSAGFAFTDSAANDFAIDADIELSSDAIYVAVRALGAPPLRIGEIEIRIARLLFGFGYTRRSVAFAFAGELTLPESLVDLIDTSDVVGAGIRIPVHTKLDLKFEVMPLVLGDVVIPIPIFMFDWDLRKNVSPPLTDPRIAEPYWDGLQVVVPDVVRVALKHISYTPFLTFYACSNSDFDADFSIGTKDTGLSLIIDNAFWAYGQDSWTANVLSPITGWPFADNFCFGLRAAGFRLNFNVQRPIPTMSPFAIFEMIALITSDFEYDVAPRGELADSMRISLTDAYLILPPAARRLFPGVDGTMAKPFEATLNLDQFIELMQACYRVVKGVVRAAISAGTDASRVAQQLGEQAAQLQAGGIDGLLLELLPLLPAELRATHLDASFAGFDGHAVIVIAGRETLAAELAERGNASSPFHAAEFADFGSDDIDAIPSLDSGPFLTPDDIVPATVDALDTSDDPVIKELTRRFSAKLRGMLRAHRGSTVTPELRTAVARELNGILSGGGSGKTPLGTAFLRNYGGLAGERLTGKGLDRGRVDGTGRVDPKGTGKGKGEDAGGTGDGKGDGSPPHQGFVDIAGMLRGASGWSRGKDLVIDRPIRIREIVDTALPTRPASALVIAVAAHLRFLRSLEAKFIGFLASDGSFAMTSRAEVRKFDLHVAGIDLPCPITIDGRLTLAGRAAPDGLHARLIASGSVEWTDIGGVASVKMGTGKADPVWIEIDDGVRFAVRGPGTARLLGDLIRVDGHVDISNSHCLVSGTLKVGKGGSRLLNAEVTGRIGPGAHFEVVGNCTAVDICGLAGAPDVVATVSVDERGARFSGAIDDTWRIGPDGELQVDIEASLEGAISVPADTIELDLMLRGAGSVSCSQLGFEVDGTFAISGKQSDPTVDVSGDIWWNDQKWLSGHARVSRREITVGGAASFTVPVTPTFSQSGSPIPEIYVGGTLSISLTFTDGLLSSSSIDGQVLVFAKIGNSDGAMVPLVSMQLPPGTPLGPIIDTNQLKVLLPSLKIDQTGSFRVYTSGGSTLVIDQWDTQLKSFVDFSVWVPTGFSLGIDADNNNLSQTFANFPISEVSLVWTSANRLAIRLNGNDFNLY